MDTGKEWALPTILARWFGAGVIPAVSAAPWPPGLLWTYLISHAAIGLAYYAIAAGLVYLIRRRPSVRFNWMFGLFSLFIFACGTTHLIEAWTPWFPNYWLDTLAVAVTAVASVITATLFWPVIPKVLQLPTNRQLRAVIAQLQHEVDERKKAEESLRQSQATLRELAAYQEHVREDERKRIAREIHDELGQNLLALRFDVAALHERTSERHPLLKQRVADALGYIDTTMKSMRSIVNNLRPPVLDLGLQVAIEWQARQFQARSRISCELSVDDDGTAVPEEQAVAVFRILQESLNNIGRHARATAVRVELKIDREQLTMAIRDNGVGIFPGDRRKAHRFGLVGIEERITLLSGKLSIDSVPGHGTLLRISMPMQQQMANEIA